MNLLAHLRRHTPQRFALALILGYALALHALSLGFALGAGAKAAILPAEQISCLGHSIPGTDPAGGDAAQHDLAASCVKACFGAVANLDASKTPDRSVPELRIAQPIFAEAGVNHPVRSLPVARGPPEA